MKGYYEQKIFNLVKEYPKLPICYLTWTEDTDAELYETRIESAYIGKVLRLDDYIFTSEEEFIRHIEEELYMQHTYSDDEISVDDEVNKRLKEHEKDWETSIIVYMSLK